jgi:hypothetical protein
MSEPVVAATSTSAPVHTTEFVPSGDMTPAPHLDVPDVLVTTQASSLNRRMILAGGACAMAIVALVALPGRSHVKAPIVAVSAPADSAVARVRNASATLPTQENVVVTPVEEQVVVRPVDQARMTATGKVPLAATTSSQLAASPAASVALDSEEPARANGSSSNQPIAASPAVAAAIVKAEAVEATAARMPTVTITGCLEKRDNTFRLTATDGDAPKSRSWKSGFLAKRPAAVELVDAASNLWLAAQIGQRVSATGTLDDRELHVRSVRRATGACN